jgi:thiaminase/transcriptional activator TenA
MNYGSPLHASLRAASGKVWTNYVEHEFVTRLGDGSLPRENFLHYLRQDYVYLIHYTRAWSLAVVKSRHITEMRTFAEIGLALIDGEMQLHIETCAKEGISHSELEATTEEVENLAYTRFVTDAGLSGDLLDMLTALVPCAMGYGEIGLRLSKENTGKLAGHPYASWIKTYADPEYQSLCQGVGGVYEQVAARTIGSDPGSTPRWPALLDTYKTACRLESAFWSMGLRGTCGPALADT